eukprot:scaffold8173_cov105-Cylindrotheca_fusiformis.AAC.2
MKFSHTLLLNSNPDWIGENLDYVGLKKEIKSLSSQYHDNEFIQDDIYDEMMTNIAHDLDHGAEVFLKRIENEAVSIRRFYLQKRKELDHEFTLLQQKIAPPVTEGETPHGGELAPLMDPSNRGDMELVHKDIGQLFTQYHNLRTYANLNCTGIRKILKKYDKCMNDTLTEVHLSRLLATLPFSDDCSGIDRCLTCLRKFFAELFCDGNIRQAEKRMDLLVREFVEFQQRSIWLDVQRANRRNDQMSVNPSGSSSSDKSSVHRAECTIGAIKSNRKVQMGLCIFLTFLWILWWPGIFDDDPAKRNALAMFVFVSLLWATEVLPIFVTAMLPPLLSVVLRVIVVDGVRLDATGASQVVFESTFSHVIMLLIGVFSIAAAVSKHSVAKAVASSISKKSGTNNRTVLLVHMLLATLSSMLISNVAAPVLSLSLIEPVLKAAAAGKSRASFGTSQWISAEQDDRLCRALILGIALASNVGGMASPISSPQNLFAIEYAQIGWVSWTTVSIPLCLLLDLAIWMWLVYCFDIDSMDSVAVAWALQRDRSGSTRLSKEQCTVIVVCIGVVLLWCLSGSLAGVFGEMGVLGIIPFICFFGTNILSRDDLNNFLWGVVVLAMGGLVFGEAITSSGLFDAFAGKVASFIESKSMSPWGVMCILTFSVFICTTFMPRTAGAIVFLPVAHAVGAKMEPSLGREFVFAGALSCSASMGLPVSGFPNMTATGVEDMLGRRYLRTRDFIMYAVPASFFAWLAIVTFAYGMIVLVL